MTFNHIHHHEHHHHHHDEHHHRHHHEEEEETVNHPPPGLTYPPPPPGLTHPYPHEAAPYAAPVYTHPVPAPYPPADGTHYAPHPAYVDLVTHASVPDELLNKPTFRIFSKAGPDYSLTIRNGEVVLALKNPEDVNQHWYKDEKFSTRVKDSEGSPAFSLINRGTGDAIKHSVGSTQPIRLTRYEPSILDVDVLWTESRDLGDGYRAVRQVNNINLNMDAFHGDHSSGGVHDGTIVVLWEWKAGDNQQWKILRFLRLMEL
ncbi:putative ricin B, lectin domain-containing protein [Lupinus albus]|uniref:Putative ricin B, lectin domain-containing protein n=1 Tax=Lupinus albus TaxID=3870 RepID=A0A6A4N9U3_LUPAL|nr:putative ricin B, lectin domain-containing protein [Lupinus albus]